jgi:AcrR family transcriptional regulator
MITQRQKATQATKQRIAEAALALFVEKGVDGTTTRDIATKAEISEGAMYRHFESKETLADDLFLEEFKPFSKALAQLQAMDAPLAEKVDHMVRYVYQAFDANPPLWKYVVTYQSGPWSKVPKGIATPVSVVAKMLEDARAKKEIEGSDIPLLTQLVIGLVTQPAIGVVFGEVELPLSPKRERVVAAVVAVLGL